MYFIVHFPHLPCDLNNGTVIEGWALGEAAERATNLPSRGPGNHELWSLTVKGVKWEPEKSSQDFEYLIEP